MKNVDEDHRDLLVEIMQINLKNMPKKPEIKKQKKMLLKAYIYFLKVEKSFLMILKVE